MNTIQSVSNKTPEALLARIKAWEAEWSGHFKRTILRGMNGEWAYAVVTREFRFNPGLEESLCELDISVAQDPPDRVEHFGAIAIPPTTEDREDAFARSFLNSDV